MHVYHFAPYEPSALKRLMGRYGVREDEIDRMLRAKLFIDLHTVVKRSVRASVEQYSLKAWKYFTALFAKSLWTKRAGPCGPCSIALKQRAARRSVMR